MQRENPPSLSTMLKCAGRFCTIRLFAKYTNGKITASFFSRLSRSHRSRKNQLYSLYLNQNDKYSS